MTLRLPGDNLSLDSKLQTNVNHPLLWMNEGHVQDAGDVSESIDALICRLIITLIIWRGCHVVNGVHGHLYGSILYQDKDRFRHKMRGQEEDG